MIGFGLGLWSARTRVQHHLDFRTAEQSSGVFVLPSWLAITCATTGRTVQTSASTLRTGFGANASRARSVDGSTWGLSVESARTNLVANPNVYSGGSWTKNTGVTVAADSGDVADPAGSNVEDKLSYDGSGVANDYRINQGLLAPSANGTKYTMSFWARLLSGSRAMFGSQNITEVAAAITSTWTRFANTGTGDGATNLQHRLDDGVALNSAFSCYLFGSQSEVGAYPSSFIVGARAADVLTVAAPAQIARGGFFDISLVVAPHYTQAEQAADHNLVYFGSNDRAFIRQSDHKVVLRIGGADVVSSALTWSRNQALTVRVRHLASGRTLTVSGATSGSGSTTGVAVSAITLPATAYLLGGATGAEESADLQALTVATTVRDR